LAPLAVFASYVLFDAGESRPTLVIPGRGRHLPDANPESRDIQRKTGWDSGRVIAVCDVAPAFRQTNWFAGE
jgi:hypothetical protein